MRDGGVFVQLPLGNWKDLPSFSKLVGFWRVFEGHFGEPFGDLRRGAVEKRMR